MVERLSKRDNPKPDRSAAVLDLVSEKGYSVPRMKTKIVVSDPHILGGTPVFRGTRVPIQTLLDYIENGQTIDDFLKGFPTVKRGQVIEFLEEAKERVLAHA